MGRPFIAPLDGAVPRPARPLRWIGPALAVVIAVGLFSLFSIEDRLSRDESIYLYGGQQLAAGVPPYVSIVDPKTPLATMTAGVAVWTGRVMGVDDVVAARGRNMAAQGRAVKKGAGLGLGSGAPPFMGGLPDARASDRLRIKQEDSREVT